MPNDFDFVAEEAPAEFDFVPEQAAAAPKVSWDPEVNRARPPSSLDPVDPGSGPANYQAPVPDFAKPATFTPTPANLQSEAESARQYETSIAGISPDLIPQPKSLAGKAAVAPIRTAAGILGYLSSPRGITESVVAASPAGPLMTAKWAYDMFAGAKDSAERIIDAAADPEHADLNQVADDISNTVAGVYGTGKISAHELRTRTGQLIDRLYPERVKLREELKTKVETAFNDALKKMQNRREATRESATTPDTQGEPVEQSAEQQMQAAADKNPITPEIKAKVRVDKNEDGTWQVSAELPNGDTVVKDYDTQREAADNAFKLEQEGHTPSEHSQELTDSEVESLKTAPEEEHEPDMSTPEGMEQYAEQVAKRYGHSISLEEPGAKGENVPFGRQTSGYFFRSLGEGKIGMRRAQFQKWIQGVPPELRRQAIESRVNEEAVHNEVIDSLGGISKANRVMEEYWGNMTSVEKGIARRRYTGQWGAGEHTDSQLGHEAVRFRLQRARGMTPSEFAETARKERWTLKSLTMLEDMVRKAREGVGTGAATRNKSILSDLDKAMENIKAAKPVAQKNDEARPEAAIREDEMEGLPLEQQGKLGHSDGIEYGVTLNRDSIPRLEKKYNDSAKAMQKAFLSGSDAESKAAFGKMNYYGGALQGASRGEHPVAGGNYAAWLKHRQQAEISSQPEASIRNPKETADKFGVRYDGEIPGTGIMQFTARDSKGVESTSFSLKKGATEQDFITKYNQVRESYAGEEHQPRPLPEIAPEASIRRQDDTEYKPGNYEVTAGYTPGKYEPAPDLPLERGGEEISFPEASRRDKKREAEIGMREGDLPFGQRTAADVEKERQTKEGETIGRLTGQDIQKAAATEVSKSIEKTGAESFNTPKFGEFRDWVKRNVGPVGDTQIAHLWEDEVWKHLLNASPERLAELRRGLNLEGKYGTRDIAAPPSNEKAAALPVEKGRSADSYYHEAETLEKVATGLSQIMPKDKAAEQQKVLMKKVDSLRAKAEQIEGVSEDKAARKVVLSRRNYRANLISEIGRRMLKDVIPDYDLERSSITMEDIDFGNPDSSEGSFRQLSGRERENPDVLSKILRDEARTKGKPLSNTKRLVAVVDPRTKEVHLLSTYWDGSAQKVVDPVYGVGKARPNRNLDGNFLARYKPIASILLNGPVKDFHQRFESVSEFNEKIGKEAEAMSQQGDWVHPGEGADTAESMDEGWRRMVGQEEAESAGIGGEPIEGTPGLPSEAGTISGGPGSTEAAAGLGKGAGVLERAKNVPMTPREARALWDVFEKNEIESGEDLGNYLEYLGTKAKTKDPLKRTRQGLSGQEYQVIAAIDKAVAATQRMLEKHSPNEATIDNAIKVALQEIYGSISIANEIGEAGSGKRENFIVDALRTFGGDLERNTGAARPEADIPRSKTERELTMRSRVAPTVTRGIEGKPVYAGRESPPLTPGYTPPRPIEKLEGNPTPPPKVETAPKMERSPKLETTPNISLQDILSKKKIVSEVRSSEQEHLDQWLQKARFTSERFPEASIRQTADLVKDQFDSMKRLISSGMLRKVTKDQFHTTRDVADNNSSIRARNSGNAIREASKSAVKAGKSQTRESLKEAEMVRRAAKAVIATGEIQWQQTKSGKLRGFWAAERSKLAQFIGQVDNAIKYADAFIAKNDPYQRMMGRKWKEAAVKLREELDYAQTNWSKSALKDAVRTARTEMRDQWQWEKDNGLKSVRRDMNYVPGRYDAELWNDNRIMFGPKVIGRNFFAGKTFKNYYEAIEAGPYIPTNFDVADLVEHRVRQGSNIVNKNIWFDSMRSINDPVSGEPIVAEPVERHGKPSPPTPEYRIRSFDNGRTTLAVRKGFDYAVRSAAGEESWIRETPVTREALRFTQFLKHNGILIYDSFHPARLLQYSFALTGIPGAKGIDKWTPGWSALEFRESDIPKAVANGTISQAAADWAQGEVEVNFGKGTKVKMSRRQLVDAAVQNGLNVGRLQDSLYGEVKHLMPGLATMNRFVFDKMTRGLMVETAVRNFEKYNKSHPDTPFNTLMRDVVKDTNIFYGSLGRQGIIRSPMMRDMSQMFLLAPQWVEGLAQKEARFYSRLSGFSALTGRRKMPYMGTLGSGMAKGLAAYFVMTQALNLISRGQPTWKNPEEGHKMDAWIPTGPNEGDGFWVNPASVFAELSHDVLRMLETKPTTWDAIEQVGSNKLGPWGRMAAVMASKQDAYGRYIPTTGGRLMEMGNQLAPVPITFGKLGQEAGYQMGIAQKPASGSVIRQSIASFAGVKTQPGESATQQISKKADRFARENDLKTDTVHIQQTTEPSYGKLRSAIRNGDMRTASKVYNDLMRTRSEQQIIRAMSSAARRPFTGSNNGEQMFLNSLSDQDLELYSKARQQQLQELNAFLDFVSEK